jgi:hypothetical protein
MPGSGRPVWCYTARQYTAVNINPCTTRLLLGEHTQPTEVDLHPHRAHNRPLAPLSSIGRAQFRYRITVQGPIRHQHITATQRRMHLVSVRPSCRHALIWSCRAAMTTLGTLPTSCGAH